MFTKDEKKLIATQLKQHGIQHKGEVFAMIERGATPTEVEAFIQQLIAEKEAARKPVLTLSDQPHDYTVFGRGLIAQNTLDDMNAIMRLPYVTGGAVMPDGHRVQENHVPVGGVVLSDAIVPGIVGADIACSVLITITSQPLDDEWVAQSLPSMKYVLRNYAYFGQEINPDPVVFDQDFHKEGVETETDLGHHVYHKVKQIARNHFGTSGDGNHFLEIGGVNIQPRAGGFYNTGKKRYLAVLSHFGSRAVGSTVADTFQTAALDRYDMPKGMTDAPLDLSTSTGRDYFNLMNYAGAFAEAGHRWLHPHILKHLGDRVALQFGSSTTIYSRHNFAWLTDDGYLHRKGATPAASGEYGVIPATMGDQTQIVIGLGNPDSMGSASHGAGRRYSRGTAIQQFGKTNTAEYLLDEYGVHLLGGGPDEDPRAYKPIAEVMAAQESCVTAVGNFTPIAVRMADPRFTWR